MSLYGLSGQLLERSREHCLIKVHTHALCGGLSLMHGPHRLCDLVSKAPSLAQLLFLVCLQCIN